MCVGPGDRHTKMERVTTEKFAYEFANKLRRDQRK
jgi:hypothetical protein